MMRVLRIAAAVALAAACAAIAACGTTTGKTAVSSTNLGSPTSRYCQQKNPCPGFTKTKLEVCGECDPGTRYFRQAMCSLDGKLRKAVDSCVRSTIGIKVDAKDVFGGRLKACLSQKLENEKTLLDAFSEIAKKHRANEADQKAWRARCDALWEAHLKRKSGGGGASNSGGSGASKTSGGSSAAGSAAPKGYVALVNEGNALKKAGKFAAAIDSYVKALADQQHKCQSGKRGAFASLPADSPCRRATKILFNIAITRRDQGKHAAAEKAFASYLEQWRRWFPKARFYPYEARARFEMAQAAFAGKRWKAALAAYRAAQQRWRAQHGKKRARFADTATRRIAACLAKLGRKREAITAYKRFLRDYRKAHGRAHADAKHIASLIKKLK